MNPLRALVVLIALGVSTSALAEVEFYAGFGFGNSNADSSPGHILSALSDKNYDITSVAVDSKDKGWRFLTGLRFSEVWAVELGYIDLGESSTNIVANISPIDTAQFTQDVANVLPVMPRGITLAGVARISAASMGMQGATAEDLNIAFKLGMIDADSERKVNGAFGKDSKDASPFYGVTLGWEFSDFWRGVIGYEVYNMADSTEYWSAGVEFKLPDALH